MFLDLTIAILFIFGDLLHQHWMINITVLLHRVDDETSTRDTFLQSCTFDFVGERSPNEKIFFPSSPRFIFAESEKLDRRLQEKKKKKKQHLVRET